MVTKYCGDCQENVPLQQFVNPDSGRYRKVRCNDCHDTRVSANKRAKNSNAVKECDHCFQLKPKRMFVFNSWAGFKTNPSREHSTCSACRRKKSREDWNRTRINEKKPYTADYDWIWRDIPAYVQRVNYSEEVINKWRKELLGTWEDMTDLDITPYYSDEPMQHLMDLLAQIAVVRWYAVKQITTLEEERDSLKARVAYLEQERLDYDTLYDDFSDAMDELFRLHQQ